jgi:signal transduction histidine kinase
MSPSDTFFASPERQPHDVVSAQRARLLAVPYLAEFLEAFPTPAIVLNGHRQILLHNRKFVESMPEGDYDRMLGLRLGESLGCSHATETESGCGTSEHCHLCGAVIAMLDAQRGERSVQECRISVDDEGGFHAMDFRVHSVPLVVNGDEVTVLSLVDISDVKRRRVLERIFFHDVLNTVGGLQTLSDVMRMVPSEERDELIDDLEGISGQLINEISMQRDIVSAEGSELLVSLRQTTTNDLLEHIHALYRFNTLAQGRQILCVNHAEGSTLTTDPTLLARSLGNLIKNALEASPKGATVTVTCASEGEERLVFSVHNTGYIPEDVRLQVFNRSFSTKGPGRGIGTYSVKLIVERFLDGHVEFTSSEEEGTRFSVHIPRQLITPPSPDNDAS